MPILVVDAANVMGSRPDGWWRDRAGAAQRLHASLASMRPRELAAETIVLVLEGAARAGHVEGREGRLRTVHASGSGDDTIVALACDLAAPDDGRVVTVVTADRELRRRVEAAGAQVRGPGWLLGQLGQPGSERTRR